MEFDKLIGLSIEDILENKEYAYCVYMLLRWQDDIPTLFNVNNIDRRMYKKQIEDAVKVSEELKKSDAPSDYVKSDNPKSTQLSVVSTYTPFELQYRTVKYNLEDADKAILSILDQSLTTTAKPSDVKSILRNIVSFIVYNYDPKYLKSRVVLKTINEYGGVYLRQSMYRINMLLEHTSKIGDVLIPYETMDLFKMPPHIYTDYSNLAVLRGYNNGYKINRIFGSPRNLHSGNQNIGSNRDVNSTSDGKVNQVTSQSDTTTVNQEHPDINVVINNMKLFSGLMDKIRFETIEGLIITGSMLEACLVDKQMNKDVELSKVFATQYAGSDMDICISSVDTEELNQVVEKIRLMVLEHDENVTVTQISERKWQLNSTLGHADIYRMKNIVTRIQGHHLSCVRAMMLCGEVPKIYAFPTFMYSAWHSMNTNVSWGNSKSDARACILKYLTRGYGAFMNESDYKLMLIYFDSKYPGPESLTKKIYGTDLHYRDLTKCTKGLVTPIVKS